MLKAKGMEAEMDGVLLRCDNDFKVRDQEPRPDTSLKGNKFRVKSV